MSFLTPLYIAAIAAVVLPVLFHMIRRTPRGRVPFSTLMFLDPSPPRITRRSRLDNWPLLLLRALALTLLAVAFARPFWRTPLSAGVDANSGRQIAILLDTSASMRRGHLWNDAVARARRIVDESSTADRIGLFTFDRMLKPLVAFDEWSSLEPAVRKKLVRQRLVETEPGWGATELGDALAHTAETLVAADSSLTDRQPAQSKEIVLISDVQAGSRTQPLGTFQWPAEVKLLIEQVAPQATTNAGLQLAAAEATSPADDATVRVRVVNAADSTREQFQLTWQGEGPFFAAAQPIDVYVPAGGSRIVRVPFDPNLPAPARLVLTGDDHDFDNAVEVDRPRLQTLNVVYVGDDEADDPAGLRYYVERAFPDNRLRRVQVVGLKPDGPAISLDTHEVGVIIVAEPLTEAGLQPLRRHAEEGGSLLFVASSAEVCRSFGWLIGRPELSVREADVAGYAMLGEVDFSHPLFAPFDDPRFSDFTSIHFWKHRKIDANDLGDCRILARFDDAAPAVVTKQLGRGTATLFTAGWHPADGQWALSTKFVPMLNALLDLHAGRLDQRQPAAAALAADESNTAPMPLEKLESLGVRLKPAGTPAAKAAAAQRDRQLKAAELEGRQKIWQWLIVAAIAALIVETRLAGRITQDQRRSLAA